MLVSTRPRTGRTQRSAGDLVARLVQCEVHSHCVGETHRNAPQHHEKPQSDQIVGETHLDVRPSPRFVRPPGDAHVSCRVAPPASAETAMTRCSSRCGSDVAPMTARTCRRAAHAGMARLGTRRLRGTVVRGAAWPRRSRCGPPRGARWRGRWMHPAVVQHRPSRTDCPRGGVRAQAEAFVPRSTARGAGFQRRPLAPLPASPLEPHRRRAHSHRPSRIRGGAAVRTAEAPSGCRYRPLRRALIVARLRRGIMRGRGRAACLRLHRGLPSREHTSHSPQSMCLEQRGTGGTEGPFHHHELRPVGRRSGLADPNLPCPRT